MDRLANYAVYIITTIVTIVSFVGFLTSNSWKSWAKQNSEWIFYSLIILFIISAILLKNLIDEKRQHRELQASIAKPSDHDRKLFLALSTALPPDGQIIEWLKDNFIANRFLDKDFNAIESVLRSMRLRTLEFDVPELETSYDQLYRSIERFENEVLNCMWIDSNQQWLKIPQEWDDKKFKEASRVINEARLDLVQKYNNFLKLAHKKGIDG